MIPNKHYVYNGPVMGNFGVLSYNWSGETYAPSIMKAVSNLKHQFVVGHHLPVNSKITFVNDVQEK